MRKWTPRSTRRTGTHRLLHRSQPRGYRGQSDVAAGNARVQADAARYQQVTGTNKVADRLGSAARAGGGKNARMEPEFSG
jgi:hypothetical protein